VLKTLTQIGWRFETSTSLHECLALIPLYYTHMALGFPTAKTCVPKCAPVFAYELLHSKIALELFSCLSLSISVLKRYHRSLQSQSVFVKNFNFKVTDESLKQHFSTKLKSGSLKSATVWIGCALIMDIRCILQQFSLSVFR